MIPRRTLVAGLAASAGSLSLARWACAAPAPAPSGVVTPEQFGARGDGVTNDSAAFAALATHVNAAGGGTIQFRRATYLVGAQKPAGAGGAHGYESASLLAFMDCRKPLILRGHGARIRCADGLRYGTFNPRTGRATRNRLPFYGKGEQAFPYWAMIAVQRCGSVEISDLELDGNLPRLVIGGPWGDTGHQIASYGLALYDNAGPELVRNVYSHHHALDGLLIDGVNAVRRTRSRFERVHCEYNGRQGCSMVGGRGYDFVDCRFAHTGKGGLVSAPGAGFDIEAENKQIRDVTFRGCDFVDNSGPGLVADSGDSERVSFTDCTFVGTTAWSAWPKKPYLRFEDCTFVGALTQVFGDSVKPDRATRFLGCTFRDDPALSPTGAVYGGEHANRPAADLGENYNVLLDRCTFQLSHSLSLPWSTRTIYKDCTMRQASPLESYPRGTYLGRTSITGRAVLSGSAIRGEVILNGNRLAVGVAG